jgi:hypothetical protein
MVDIGDKVDWVIGDGLRIKVKVVGLLDNGKVAVVKYPWTFRPTVKVWTSELVSRETKKGKRWTA